MLIIDRIYEAALEGHRLIIDRIYEDPGGV